MSSSSQKVVWAAGGVLWRRSAAGIEVALVHRRRYDDWSLPKGKTEPGELLVATAARELVEETGYEVRMGHRLITVEYRLGSGALKKVAYWSVAATGGEFVVNHECDTLRWHSIDDAIAKVSYAADRKVLRTFASKPVDELHTMLLVRHAKAGRRAKFRGDDRDRPLDQEGRRQAAALTELLGLFGAHHLHAADRLRCVQTLVPLSEALRESIEVEPTLTEEAYAADPDASFERLLALAASDEPVRAVCSQGKVIPPVLARWAERDGVRLPASRNRKGSVCVLTLRGDTLIAVDHIPSPFAD
ncbi:NUDIX hydrolase [Gordonia sp. HY002]|uniref:NUDIX hydrolase n=1 Tax=Gordonia zhenghanii TaxID=2911516 RepID=UPI001EF07CD5|nr:NUDIX hydrolase [Gordonia zhenghanii]MCF8571356.1 NUDIX hydrolase [Gordonia zhenghanii]MCF8604868.1 NUDIX hydrolase [Gordonia zhenghanii]